MAYRSYLGSLEYALYIARVPLESVRHDPRPAHLSFQQTVPTHPGDLFTERRTVQSPRICRDLEQQTVSMHLHRRTTTQTTCTVLATYVSERKTLILCFQQPVFTHQSIDSLRYIADGGNRFATLASGSTTVLASVRR